MLEVIDLFREKGTVDELGLGVIRDSFANYLFPGTSTLHSRARYWLFVPWIYQRLESKRTPSSQVDERARRLQAGLVRSLETGGESEGVIGIEARDKVLRPPAVLYWAGLQRHGLNVLAGSIGRYHASLDAFYRSAGRGGQKVTSQNSSTSGPGIGTPGVPSGAGRLPGADRLPTHGDRSGVPARAIPHELTRLVPSVGTRAPRSTRQRPVPLGSPGACLRPSCLARSG